MEKRVSKQVQSNLTIVEATALLKMAEKEVERLKDGDKKVEPGGYNFEFNVECRGSLSRGSDTQVSPKFNMSNLLKAVILRYAVELDEPEEWLNAILGTDGILGSVITFGPKMILAGVDHKLLDAWKAAEDKAKEKHKKTSKKTPRAGNTNVAGTMAKIYVPETDI